MPESPAYNLNPNPNTNTNHNPNASSAKSGHIKPSDQSAAKKIMMVIKVNGAHAKPILLSSPPLCQKVQHITLTLTLTLTLTVTLTLAQLSLDTLNQAINQLQKKSYDGCQGEWCPC